MVALEPSFITKVRRAEQHLEELDAVVGRYVESNPYTMRWVREGEHEVPTLHFTSTVGNTAIPSITTDVVHNLRSGLDHLAAALVPANRRRRVHFPIYWEGVWNDPVEGEDPERSTDRKKWAKFASWMRPEAVAVLKGLQPPDNARYETLDKNFFRMLNVLSNTDKHEKFPAFSQGLQYPVLLTWTNHDGSSSQASIDRGDGRLAEDQTGVDGVPDGAADVQIVGTPLVVLRVRGEHGYVPLPTVFHAGIDLIRREAIGRLYPFLHPEP